MTYAGKKRFLALKHPADNEAVTKAIARSIGVMIYLLTPQRVSGT